jgi:hypothetical protein
MVQGGEHFRFALKSCQSVRIRRHGRWENLDRDLTFQLGVGRAVDLAHAACSDLRGDFVDTETRTGSKSQIAWDYTCEATEARFILQKRRSVDLTTAEPPPSRIATREP